MVRFRPSFLPRIKDTTVMEERQGNVTQRFQTCYAHNGWRERARWIVRVDRAFVFKAEPHYLFSDAARGA